MILSPPNNKSLFFKPGISYKIFYPFDKLPSVQSKKKTRINTTQMLVYILQKKKQSFWLLGLQFNALLAVEKAIGQLLATSENIRVLIQVIHILPTPSKNPEN